MNEIDQLALEAVIYGDSAHVMHLVLEGRTAEADDYSQRADVQARIRRWQANR